METEYFLTFTPGLAGAHFICLSHQFVLPDFKFLGQVFDVEDLFKNFRSHISRIDRRRSLGFRQLDNEMRGLDVEALRQAGKDIDGSFNLRDSGCLHICKC